MLYCLCSLSNFFVFYAVRVVSKEIRRLVAPRTCCYCCLNDTHCPVLSLFMCMCFLFPSFLSVYFIISLWALE
jgi:hypothetical protein